MLRQCDGQGGVEAWIAERRWQAVPSGWSVKPELQGWRFRLEVGPRGCASPQTNRGRVGQQGGWCGPGCPTRRVGCGGGSSTTAARERFWPAPQQKHAETVSIQDIHCVARADHLGRR